MRLLASVQLLVKEATFFHWMPNPTMEELAEGRLYSHELVQYLIDNLRHNSREMSANRGGGRGRTEFKPRQETLWFVFGGLKMNNLL